jgi:threonine synthase
VQYLSTRGAAPRLTFDEVVLAGLASDGGLYLPETWPQLAPQDVAGMAQLSYPQLTARILALFAAPDIDEATLAAIAEDAYRRFDRPDIAPLTPLKDNEWLLELFHGPTLAFKDYALQILGRLFDLVLKRRGERITIVGATSGDTGSAAIDACRDREAVEIFILHPMGRVSAIQRRQMTTVASPNVHNIAIEGTFDDCQDLVKALFNNHAFRDHYRLAAVNSINWARIAAQIVYYAYACLKLGEASFAVPTGNFGNVFAAYAARRMGFPVRRLVIGSNRNDILTRFFTTGRMQIASVRPTLSPSMDIQISSNFERYLFELYDRDGAAIAELMRGFRATGSVAVDPARWREAGELFSAVALDDGATLETIRSVHAAHGIIVDPHTAIGIAAGRAVPAADGVPMVAVATAHPAKFPEAVERATGLRPPLPEAVQRALDTSERYAALPARIDAVADYIAETLQRRGLT